MVNVSNDPMVGFFNLLKGNSEKVNYGLTESVATRKEVSVESNHDGLLAFRKIKEGKIKENMKSKTSTSMNEKMTCNCGKKINVPSKNCSVMCSCGKIHS